MSKAGNMALLVASAGALIWACACPQPAPAVAPLPPDAPAQTQQEGEPRTPLVATSHPDWVRVEAAKDSNSCSADDQCYVGGCEAEICSARPGLSSTCEPESEPANTETEPGTEPSSEPETPAPDSAP